MDIWVGGFVLVWVAKKGGLEIYIYKKEKKTSGEG